MVIHEPKMEGDYSAFVFKMHFRKIYVHIDSEYYIFRRNSVVELK